MNLPELPSLLTALRFSYFGSILLLEVDYPKNTDRSGTKCIKNSAMVYFYFLLFVKRIIIFLNVNRHVFILHIRNNIIFLVTVNWVSVPKQALRMGYKNRFLSIINHGLPQNYEERNFSLLQFLSNKTVFFKIKIYC